MQDNKTDTVSEKAETPPDQAVKPRLTPWAYRMLGKILSKSRWSRRLGTRLFGYKWERRRKF